MHGQAIVYSRANLVAEEKTGTEDKLEALVEIAVKFSL